jgi:predicted DNA-binding transcriptional regulator YafY
MEKVFRKSLETKKKIRIMYDKEGDIGLRWVTVYKINDLTIVAYCHFHKGIRTFKKEHILGAEWPYSSAEEV